MRQSFALGDRPSSYGSFRCYVFFYVQIVLQPRGEDIPFHFHLGERFGSAKAFLSQAPASTSFFVETVRVATSGRILEAQKIAKLVSSRFARGVSRTPCDVDVGSPITLSLLVDRRRISRDYHCLPTVLSTI